jgi:predicted nucleic-acid-binding protein
MKLNKNHIFVDTNVLNGFYLNRTTDVECLKYLFSLKGKKLFISSLTVGQFVAFFSKRFTNNQIKDMVRYLFTKFTIIEFGERDIDKSLLYSYSDMEDTIQYVIGTKMNCFYFVTNDKQFSVFRNIKALKSSEIRTVKK